MMLKLACLHLLNRFEFDFWNVVLVHVEKDIFYHDYAQFLISPQFIKTLNKFIISFLKYLFSNWFQEFSRCGFDVIVKHLPVLMQNQVVSGAVKFLITKWRGLLILYLVDSISDSLPVLICKISSHTSTVSSLFSVNLEFESWLHVCQ